VEALIGNSAYRHYLRKTGESKNTPIFEIDLGKLAEEVWPGALTVLHDRRLHVGTFRTTVGRVKFSTRTG
jgi:hypothetical protein